MLVEPSLVVVSSSVGASDAFVFSPTLNISVLIGLSNDGSVPSDPSLTTGNYEVGAAFSLDGGTESTLVAGRISGMSAVTNVNIKPGAHRRPQYALNFR
jgi:hypothetical protein